MDLTGREGAWRVAEVIPQMGPSRNAFRKEARGFIDPALTERFLNTRPLQGSGAGLQTCLQGSDSLFSNTDGNRRLQPRDKGGGSYWPLGQIEILRLAAPTH